MTSHNLGSFYPFTIRAQFLLTSVAAFFSWFLQDSIQQSAIFAKKHNTDICCQDTQRFLSMSPGCQGNGEERIAIENYYKMKQPFCYLVFSNSWDGFETCYSWTVLDSRNVHLFLPSDSKSSPWVWKKSLVRQPLVCLEVWQSTIRASKIKFFL